MFEANFYPKEVYDAIEEHEKQMTDYGYLCKNCGTINYGRRSNACKKCGK